MTQEMILGVARHVLTALGGVLIAKGVLDAGVVEQVIGAVISLAGVAWSIWAKKATVA
tara:strand:+ start:126 stop:299 length:174 start_codon:yes stop_codon:yes gene_type:complete